METGRLTPSVLASGTQSVQPSSSASHPARQGCRFCGATLSHTVVDLGMSPLCESYLAADQLNHMEPFYPLHVWVCDGASSCSSRNT